MSIIGTSTEEITDTEDSRMILFLDDQARQRMTFHFILSLQCNVLPVMGFVKHTVVLACLNTFMMDTEDTLYSHGQTSHTEAHIVTRPQSSYYTTIPHR